MIVKAGTTITGSLDDLLHRQTKFELVINVKSEKHSGSPCRAAYSPAPRLRELMDRLSELNCDAPSLVRTTAELARPPVEATWLLAQPRVERPEFDDVVFDLASRGIAQLRRHRQPLTQLRHHPSGTPARRMPSHTRSSAARYVGLSLDAPRRKRRMVKPGSSVSPAFAAVRASSSAPSKPKAAAK